jgi:hypothetical protein
LASRDWIKNSINLPKLPTADWYAYAGSKRECNLSFLPAGKFSSCCWWYEFSDLWLGLHTRVTPFRDTR